MLARRANININYLGIDITKDIAPDLLSFKYTDNASGDADDIEIELKDETAKWLKQYPQKGDKITAKINTVNWYKDNENNNLDCGSFIVDEPEYSGRPRKINIKAISMPSNTNFTNTKKSRAWEKIKFSAIAQNIADSAGLDLLFDSPVDPTYERKDQSETSDMNFLSDLSKDEGFGFKISSNKIIIYQEAKYESKQSIATISETSQNLNSYTLNTELTNTAYAACRIRYRDSKKGDLIDYTYSLKDELESTDKIFEINTIVTSNDEADRLARSKLRQLNKMEYTIKMNVLGDLRLVGGVCANLVDFGAFNGKYFIDKATHNLPKYDVDLEMHRVLEGY